MVTESLAEHEVQSSEKTSVDVVGRSDGMVMFLTPRTQRGQEWFHEHAHDAMNFGAAVVVEREAGINLTRHMSDHGLSIHSLLSRRGKGGAL
jgi:hypothetical protein